MDNLIVVNDYDQFLKRFWFFCDSVVQSYEVRYTEGSGIILNILINTRDYSDEENVEWVCAFVSLVGVEEYGLKESRKLSNQVISDGIKILQFAGFIGVEFGGYPDSTFTREDLQSSPAYALCKSINYRVMPYVESA
ncbi:hypothetical protein [Kiloniella laminariae]|uniref:hypothetical protein n=1 Tax=Kiloniella laminariae TaxID=454162 RepID=UPI0003825950|nr:hypothetical protein [Kiloniella laminariae]